MTAIDSQPIDLIGFGRLTCDQLLAVIGDAQAAWADYEGFHIGPAPIGPPPYGHLWAWTSRCLIRARIDSSTVITGALVLTSEPQTWPAAKLREQVTCQRVLAEPGQSASNVSAPWTPPSPTSQSPSTSSPATAPSPSSASLRHDRPHALDASAWQPPHLSGCLWFY